MVGDFMNITATGTKASVMNDFSSVITNGKENDNSLSFFEELKLFCENLQEKLLSDEINIEEAELLSTYINIYQGIYQSMNPQFCQELNVNITSQTDVNEIAAGYAEDSQLTYDLNIDTAFISNSGVLNEIYMNPEETSLMPEQSHNTPAETEDKVIVDNNLSISGRSESDQLSREHLLAQEFKGNTIVDSVETQASGIIKGFADADNQNVTSLYEEDINEQILEINMDNSSDDFLPTEEIKLINSKQILETLKHENMFNSENGVNNEKYNENIMEIKDDVDDIAKGKANKEEGIVLKEKEVEENYIQKKVDKVKSDYSITSTPYKNEMQQYDVTDKQVRVNISNITEKIVESITQSEKTGVRKMKIVLEPAMGELEITLKESAGKLTALVRISNDDLRGALQGSAFDIETSLKNQGVNIEHIEMSSFGSMFDASSSQQNSSDNSYADTRRQYQNSNRFIETMVEEETSKAYTNANGRINYLV